MLGRRLFRIAENNDDPRFPRNGERCLLREVFRAHLRDERKGPVVVIDAGANIGDYTREVLGLARAMGCLVEVHIFEPSPHCVEVLRREFTTASNVQILATALADSVGEAPLHQGKVGSSQASLVARHGLAVDPAGVVHVPLLRLGDYLANRGVPRVNLLKLDVEGFELAALRGAGDQLTPGNIDVIQFEYGGTTLDARTTLRDMYELLESRGYAVGKLLPSAIEVRNYVPWMENFAYANYVALAPRWVQKSIVRR